MSIKVMSRVWDYSQAKGTPLLVLLSLADFADDEGECWPSISTIAKKCRLADERHVRRVIHDDLEDRLGEVVVIPNEGKSSSKGGLRSNRYRIVVHMPEEDTAIVVEGPPSSTNDGGSQTLQIVVEGPPRTLVEGPPESPVEPSLKLPLNPQRNAGDHKPARRGMRGTGTSPRELRSAAQQAVDAQQNEAESDRLVTAIVDTYGHLSEDVVIGKIAKAFAHDPIRHQQSLDYYRRPKVTAS